MGLTARSRDGAYRVRMRCRCLSGTQRQLAGRTRSKCCVGDGAGLHFVGAFLLHYQYPSSSGHLDGFNGSKQRRPDVSEYGAVAFPAHRGSWLGEHAPDATLGMGGVSFVGAFLLHYQYPLSPGHLDGFNGSEQRRTLTCQNAVPLPFQQIEAAGWENTLQMWRWGWGGFIL